MAQERRTPTRPDSNKMDQGIILAKVIGYMDPSFMGGLEVTLLREHGNSIGDLNQTYYVKYASPFYGATAYEYMGLNKSDFNDTQKSYGMWFPTPEIGTTVMCVFVDGNPSEGYWIACIPGRFTNQMIPAIGASTDVELSPADKTKYDTAQPLPVAEINRKTNELEKSLKVDKIKKAVHPIADRFLEQGLLEDDVRGATTSTSRRSIPNTVFGISTPGPLDRRLGAKKQYIGKQQSKTPVAVPVSRLGGTQLVFDDGDDRYQRKTKASEGGLDYADTLNGEKGEPDIPYNEYVRLRTRTGHQVLMHNSEDLIYIGNSRGTAWVELTSDGKIDVYSEDSISIHSENDINIRADRDINIEAGRNINMKATADYSEESDTDSNGFESGRIQIESKFNTRIIIGANGKITTSDDLEIFTGKSNNLTAGATTNILSTAGHFETAAIIHMNGPPATPAVPATDLSTHDNIRTSSDQPWAKKRYAEDNPLKSIMKRIPMHEPWALHENQAPTFLKPNSTDRES
jgi:hypothetical protein